MINVNQKTVTRFDALGWSFCPNGYIQLQVWRGWQDAEGNIGYDRVDTITPQISNDLWVDPQSLQIVDGGTEGAVQAFNYVYNQFGELKTLVENFVTVNNLV